MEWLIFALIALSSLCFLSYLLTRPTPASPRARAPQPAIALPPSSSLPIVRAQPATPPLPYVRQPQLLTRAERTFFVVLSAATPLEWVAFPQVRLANLVDVAPHARRSYQHFNRVAAKCVDFVLCERATSAPRLVVELDDSSHNRPDRQARDAFVDAALHSAGLPILHVRWQPTYDVADLAARIRSAADLPPPLTPASVPALLPRSERASIQAWACRACGADVRQDAPSCTGCGAPLRLTTER